MGYPLTGAAAIRVLKCTGNRETDAGFQLIQLFLCHVRRIARDGFQNLQGGSDGLIAYLYGIAVEVDIICVVGRIVGRNLHLICNLVATCVGIRLVSGRSLSLNQVVILIRL